jgi:hypothetical protein
MNECGNEHSNLGVNIGRFSSESYSISQKRYPDAIVDE